MQTADCGYFCGYLLMLNNQQGGYRPGGLAREQAMQAVYDERDAFLHEANLGTALRFLSAENLVRFLSFLGLQGYSCLPNSPVGRFQGAADPFKERVRSFADTRPGLILLLQRPGASSGHYIAVLGSQGRAFCCYDPLRPGPGHSGLIDADAFSRALRSQTACFIGRIR